MWIVEIITGVRPVFVTVTGKASDLVPTGRSGNVSALGATVSEPASAGAADPSGTTNSPTKTASAAHAPNKRPTPNEFFLLTALSFLPSSSMGRSGTRHN